MVKTFSLQMLRKLYGTDPCKPQEVEFVSKFLAFALWSCWWSLSSVVCLPMYHHLSRQVASEVIKHWQANS